MFFTSIINIFPTSKANISKNSIFGDDYQNLDKYHLIDQYIRDDPDIENPQDSILVVLNQYFNIFMRLHGLLNNPPDANFTYEPLNPTDLDVVKFNDTSVDDDNDIVTWLWDFGDGDYSTDQNTTHKYDDDGFYIVSLTVWDDDGANDTIQKSIYVSNVPPIADADGPYYGYIDRYIQFNGSGSYDPDSNYPSSISKGIVKYEWIFGDGNYSSLVKPEHCYKNEGLYLVSLKVWDDDDASDVDHTVAVVHKLTTTLSVDADGPYRGIVGEPIQFDGFVSGGHPPYNYSWYFGDGSTAYVEDPVHIYGRGGNYSIVLVVSDNFSSIGVDDTYAQISAIDKLIADANGPYKGMVNESLQFYGNASGGKPPYNWIWDFGDGNTSSLQNPSHKYKNDRDYEVTLTVIDEIGLTDNDGAFVKIYPYDITAPYVKIHKPQQRYLYFNNQRTFPILFTTFIIGNINVEVNSIDEITGTSRIEFYLDGDFVHSISSIPYEWFWDEPSFGKHVLKVVAFDNVENSASDELNVWKIF